MSNEEYLKSSIQQSYTETIEYLKNRFQVHMNLYQKSILEKKVGCYEGPQGDVDMYFHCIDEVEVEKSENGRKLQQTFAKIEYEQKECQKNCLSSFPNQKDQELQCELKCIEKMGSSCDNSYKMFYTQILGSHPEYKNLK